CFARGVIASGSSRGTPASRTGSRVGIAAYYQRRSKPLTVYQDTRMTRRPTARRSGPRRSRPDARRLALLLALGAASTLPAACGENESKSAISANQREIARLRRENPEASRLLASSPADFQRRVRVAHGPVVVNQWASWCGPCRYEFPLFQRLAERYRGRVTFLGVDAKDNDDDARRFL